jgi:hypothetical protein
MSVGGSAARSAALALNLGPTLIVRVNEIGEPPPDDGVEHEGDLQLRRIDCPTQWIVTTTPYLGSFANSSARRVSYSPRSPCPSRRETRRCGRFVDAE